MRLLRILVYPHDLGVGGSQLNAIEIASAVQRLGHPTVVFGRPGPLLERIAQLGLEFVEAPAPRHRPSARVIRAMIRLIDERGLDILHGYEWPPTLECVAASRLRPGTVAVSTVMSMSVAPFIPKTVPLAVGTEQIASAERSFGRRSVDTIEPPVDLVENDPELDVGRAGFQAHWGLAQPRFTVGLVTRFAYQLKLEGILAAMDAVGSLAADLPIRLVIAGDGPARTEVEQHAAAANRRYGDGTVVLVGELLDPRPVYSVADVAIGMGGSALRAMAFAKPLIVQGERGFWELLTPDSLPRFLHTGWYGLGSNPANGSLMLAAILRGLVDDEPLRSRLGAFARTVVEERFSLDAAAGKQSDAYLRAVLAGRHPWITTGADVAAAARYARYYAAKRIRRAAGTEAADDFNARPSTETPERPFARSAGSS